MEASASTSRSLTASNLERHTRCNKPSAEENIARYFRYLQPSSPIAPARDVSKHARDNERESHSAANKREATDADGARRSSNDRHRSSRDDTGHGKTPGRKSLIKFMLSRRDSDAYKLAQEDDLESVSPVLKPRRGTSGSPQQHSSKRKRNEKDRISLEDSEDERKKRVRSRHFDKNEERHRDAAAIDKKGKGRSSKSEDERAQLLEQRKQKRRAKAIIVRDRTGTKSLSKNAVKAQQEQDHQKSKHKTDYGSRNKSKHKRGKDPDTTSVTSKGAASGKYELEWDLVDIARRKRRETAVSKSVRAVKDANLAKPSTKRKHDQNPLSRASNIGPVERVTLKAKAGIYNQGASSSRQPVSRDRKFNRPPPDLAFNELPFLNQPVASVASPRRKRRKAAIPETSDSDSSLPSISRANAIKAASVELVYQPPSRKERKAVEEPERNRNVKNRSSPKLATQTKRVDTSFSGSSDLSSCNGDVKMPEKSKGKPEGRRSETSNPALPSVDKHQTAKVSDQAKPEVELRGTRQPSSAMRAGTSPPSEAQVSSLTGLSAASLARRRERRHMNIEMLSQQAAVRSTGAPSCAATSALQTVPESPAKETSHILSSIRLDHGPSAVVGKAYPAVRVPRRKASLIAGGRTDLPPRSRSGSAYGPSRLQVETGVNDWLFSPPEAFENIPYDDDAHVEPADCPPLQFTFGNDVPSYLEPAPAVDHQLDEFGFDEDDLPDCDRSNSDLDDYDENTYSLHMRTCMPHQNVTDFHAQAVPLATHQHPALPMSNGPGERSVDVSEDMINWDFVTHDTVDSAILEDANGHSVLPGLSAYQAQVMTSRDMASDPQTFVDTAAVTNRDFELQIKQSAWPFRQHGLPFDHQSLIDHQNGSGNAYPSGEHYHNNTRSAEHQYGTTVIATLPCARACPSHEVNTFSGSHANLYSADDLLQAYESAPYNGRQNNRYNGFWKRSGA